jgi:CheY-like chemotaxis protein
MGHQFHHPRLARFAEGAGGAWTISVRSPSLLLSLFPSPKSESIRRCQSGVEAIIMNSTLTSFLQSALRCAKVSAMTEPLALVLYERLMPGSQLVNRLQDRKYRVQTISDPALLVQSAEQTKPMFVLADLEPSAAKVCEAIGRLRQNPSTAHIPVIGFGTEPSEGIADQARQAGANLIASEAAILGHLDQLIDQALDIR